MADQDGPQARSVEMLLDELSESPETFDFFQAMRLLECAYKDSPRLGKSSKLSDEPIRLSQEPSLKFAPSTVAGFETLDDSAKHKLIVHFFGLCGPNGGLPLHLTEYVRDRIHHHDDHTMAAFLDVFHHRLLTLFYRAWADAQPPVHYDRPDSDRFSTYVGSLIGIGMPTMRNRDKLSDLAKLYYGGRLACQTRHPEGLRAMLADFFKLPVEIEEFIGQWVEIPEHYRFVLGAERETGSLGVNCTVGSHVWNCQQKFRVTIGPLDLNEFQRLLPGGDSLKRVTAMVRNYIGDELVWDLNLVLKREKTPSWELGKQQMGQAIWMDSDGVTEDPRDLKLNPLRSHE